MLRKYNQPVLFLKSLFLAFLIAFPPVFQSIHGAFSHHHLTSCCDHKEGDLHQQEDLCEIVNFVFYSQVLPDALYADNSPLYFQRIRNEMLPMSLPVIPALDLNSRAPPTSC
ncbi:MAG: hypothetical protein KQI35_17675 [Bacteroidetes bacterium]|nr:hypothetical protein [Bacteroidota bacterium]